MDDFHKPTLDGLRAKNFEVGETYPQSAQDEMSVHYFVSVDGVHMPVEYARDLNLGRVTFAEIKAHMSRGSN